jgi:hypothetical protein
MRQYLLFVIGWGRILKLKIKEGGAITWFKLVKYKSVGLDNDA